MSTTVLLGPQRFRQTAGAVASSLAPEGTIATVTAGWRDREKDDADLHEAMDGRAQNLHLFTRLGSCLLHDQRFSAAATAYNRRVDEASILYRVRLEHATDSLYATLRRSARQDLIDSALRAGMQSLRDIDAWYLWLLSELEAELWADGGVEDSELIAKHRADVGEILSAATLLAIAGGHVSFLIRCLRLFQAAPPPELPVMGWSAGAMALTDLIVLYNDNGPDGVRPAEVWDRGLGRAPGVVAMPHARRRVQLGDPVRNQVLAHRFTPARVLLLDDGSRVPLGADAGLPDEARVITLDGAISTVGEESAATAGGGAS